MIQTAKGAAKNTADIRAWLLAQDGIREVTEQGTELVTFNYDNQPADWPEGVYFDLAEAPF